jgi:hyperosmotically inducible protein
MQLLALFAAGTALVAAGCDRNDASRTTSTTTTTSPSTATAPSPTPTDRATAAASNAADKTAAAADRAGDKVDDAAITAKVKTALMAEPGIKSLEINVDTRDNNVTLAGTVPSAELKVRAMQIAQRVEGVKSVNDQLVVKPS